MTQSSPAPAGFSALRHAVGLTYFPVSALARLPLSMLVIGALTYVVGLSGDVATGGAVAAIAGIGVAIGAPLSGAASDHWGQRATLLITGALYSISLVLLLLAGPSSVNGVTPTLALAALFAGVVVPQAGPMTRVRWIRRYGGHAEGIAPLQAAQSYESTVDELGFVLGPAAVGIIAAVFGPAVPLYVALALTLVTIPWFALHPTAALAAPAQASAAPAATAQGGAASGSASTPTDAASAGVPWALVGLLLLGMMSIGSVFGSLATVSTSFADEAGQSGTGGLIYSTLGLTSGLAALSVARWPARWSTARRWIWCAVLLVPVLALLWLPTHPWQFTLVLLLVGAPIGPVLVTVFSAAGSRTPARRLGLVMTLLSAGITLGTSLGNWLGGELALQGGHRLALWVTFFSGVALLLAGLLFAAASRRRRVHAENDMHHDE